MLGGYFWDSSVRLRERYRRYRTREVPFSSCCNPDGLNVLSFGHREGGGGNFFSWPTRYFCVMDFDQCGNLMKKLFVWLFVWLIDGLVWAVFLCSTQRLFELVLHRSILFKGHDISSNRWHFVQMNVWWSSNLKTKSPNSPGMLNGTPMAIIS